MRQQLRVGSRLSWVIAWMLAVAAPVIYLLWPDGLTWWLGMLLPAPLIVLALWRQEKKDFADDEPGVGDVGPWPPWGPP
jgi:hypothetical protein